MGPLLKSYETIRESNSTTLMLLPFLKNHDEQKAGTWKTILSFTIRSLSPFTLLGKKI